MTAAVAETAEEGGVTGVHKSDAWVDTDFAIRAKARRKYNSGNTQVVPKGATPMFPTFPIFLVPRLDPLPVFDSLTIFHHRGTKNTGYAWLSPATA